MKKLVKMFFRHFGWADTTISPLSIGYVSGAISGQLPARTIPHCVLMSGFTSLYTWSWRGVVLGIMVLVGSCSALFLSGGVLSQGSWSWWAIVGLGFFFFLVGNCPRARGPGAQ